MRLVDARKDGRATDEVMSQDEGTRGARAIGADDALPSAGGNGRGRVHDSYAWGRSAPGPGIGTGVR